MPAHLIAIDQGTTSTRAIVFDASLAPVAAAQQELRQIYPAPGWVEHDPEEIWTAVVDHRARGDGEGRPCGQDIAGIGITNQRETTIVWDRASGKPIHNAIVWQDRRTADACAALRARRARAGGQRKNRPACSIRISPRPRSHGCSTTSMTGARAAAEAGRLAFGTVDTFLLWRLTGGKVHATDATNASRTLLFDIAPRRLGSRACRAVRCSGALAARGARLRRRLSARRAPDLFGGADPHLRRRRRSAGGDRRAGLLLARHDEVDLRHRLLRAAQHRRRAGRLAASAAHHDRLPACRPNAPTRWRARSSSPAPRCSGCATACI